MLAWVINKVFVEKNFPGPNKCRRYLGECNEFGMAGSLLLRRECPAQGKTVLVAGKGQLQEAIHRASLQVTGEKATEGL